MTRQIGELRRSQLITTFGIGSIVDAPEYSVMISGQGDWKEEHIEVIHEPRLEKFLGVSEFCTPRNLSDSSSVDVLPTIPAVRFPNWHFCPKCLKIAPLEAFGGPRETLCKKCSTPRNSVQLIPARFIVACNAGHIDDFPWNFWIRRSGCPCDLPNLAISTTAKSTALSSIFIECSGCKSRASLEGIFSSKALSSLPCNGKRPWLGDKIACQEHPVVLQRGSTSVYFPSIYSSISIPPFSTRASRLIDKHWITLSVLADGTLVDKTLETLAGQTKIELASLKEAFSLRRDLLGRSSKPDILREEYVALREPSEYDARHDFAARASEVPLSFSPFLSRVVLIDRLRMVSALRGFTRVAPTGGALAPLSSTQMDWLPGMEVNGEGIFIEFADSAIRDWKKKFGNKIEERAMLLEERRRDLIQNNRRTMEVKATPEYMLIHTFAHLFLQTLTIDCGYSSAALRERIYVRSAEELVVGMSGLLVCTTAADSEGSLGGLVRQGEPSRLEEVLAKTLEFARWCSNDPLCIESKGQGADSTNLSACHSCSLVPETACENFNNFLDRGFLFGWPECPDAGFFDRNW